MEKCPKCLDYTLSYDPVLRTACCNSYDCNFIKGVDNVGAYFKNYVISELNWSNYCAKTSPSVRRWRNTLAPVTITGLMKS